MNTLRLAAAIAVIILIPATAQARYHHHKSRHHYNRAIQQPVVNASACIYDNDGKTTCTAMSAPVQQRVVNLKRTVKRQARSMGERVATVISDVAAEGVKFIPNPPGTWRVARSCAHRLAAYWGLGKGLDAVVTWVERFPRVSSPAIGIAAVRRDQHHIMWIIGGGPGGWRVADFNSGGHRNREYTIDSFRGYFFVNPHVRVASGL